MRTLIHPGPISRVHVTVGEPTPSFGCVGVVGVTTVSHDLQNHCGRKVGPTSVSTGCLLKPGLVATLRSTVYRNWRLLSMGLLWAMHPLQSAVACTHLGWMPSPPPFSQCRSRHGLGLSDNFHLGWLQEQCFLSSKAGEGLSLEMQRL